VAQAPACGRSRAEPVPSNFWRWRAGNRRLWSPIRSIAFFANKSTDILLGAKHRPENLGAEWQELIEVQSGDDLGKNDIICDEDVR